MTAIKTTTTRRPLVATYRVQLTPSFGFAAAAELLEPLRRLGVSHLYLSPIAEAVAGSTHGYDVVDHRRVRDEFGGDAGLTALLDATAERDMGVIVDHVPNHVSVARPDANPHWWAMLHEGPDSDAARWFDVDWDLTGGRIIVPKLGEPADALVDRGDLVVVDGELRYGPLRFPLAAGTEHLPIAEALAAQHYELTWWRDPRRNVRRFFTIDDLVAVCVEHPDIAAVVDTIPTMLTEHSAFDGVRIDHVDGLADPAGYLDDLRTRLGDRWIVVEKIVAPGETLPRSWSVDGTTGYEQITVAEHTLLDPAGEAPLGAAWADIAERSNQTASFHVLEDDARRHVLADGLRPDLERLVRTAAERSTLPPHQLTIAVVELTLALTRYRTYLPDPESVPVLAAAAVLATRAVDDPAVVAEVVDLIECDDEVGTRWQQLTGPVMAKGAEDRAFYRHQRLAALCEVGGDPAAWTYGVDAFHAHQQRMQAGWPTAMLSANTHDTKRSATVRARSIALASRATDWVALASAWAEERREVIGDIRPADVWLALQTAITAWPVDASRLEAFLVKAAREADIVTGWTEPDAAAEVALARLGSALADDVADEHSALGRFARELAIAGGAVGLRLLALQLTCPGVPDLYQGAPSQLITLVDPDNRREPDWSDWSTIIDAAIAGDDIDGDDVDRTRARLVHRVLTARRDRPSAFDDRAGYEPIVATGPGAADVIAFARLDAEGRPATITVVTRSGAPPDATIELPGGPWRDLLDDRQHTGNRRRVDALVGPHGVAVLTRDT